MSLTKSSIAQLKRLAKAAKNSYYNSEKFLSVHPEQLDEEVARLLCFGRVARGRVVYPNGDERIPKRRIEISDTLYDLIEDALKENSVELPVGAPVVGKTKVKLPYKMPSLDKIRSGEGTVAKFSTRNKGPYIVSDKLDGVSIEIVYTKDDGIKAYTRGDGTTGQDISFLVPHLNLPKLKTNLAVRGEVIMQKSAFDQFADEFRNARNLTSGILNTKGVHSAIKHVDVVCYEVLAPFGVPSEQLARLKAYGLKVVPHTVVGRLTDDVLSTMLKQRRAKSRYELDGLVVCRDAKNTPPADGNPSYAVAFKQDSEGNLAQTTVVKVWWEVSKHRVLKPRLEIEPVQLSGVEVKFCTAYNAAYIRDHLLGPGAVISVTRSGEVIPKVLEVIKPAKTAQMPTEPCAWNKTNVDLVLTEDVQHTGSEVKAIDAFLSQGLGVEHVAGGILARVYESGLTTISSILRAKQSDFLKVEGVKDTMAAKIYSQIRKGCENADINKVAANSGIFGHGMGSRRVAVITDKYDLFELSKKPVSRIFESVVALPGFSDITAKQFATNLPKFIAWVSALPITFSKVVKAKVSGSKLSGQNVCFTGVRDSALESLIVDQGGTIVSGVNSRTTHLICKDPDSGSSKNVKARELDIPILTIAQYKSKYRL